LYKKTQHFVVDRYNGLLLYVSMNTANAHHGEAQMRTAAKFHSITEFKPDPICIISRRVESPVERAAYARIEAGARVCAARVTKDGARKYVLQPSLLDLIEPGLARLTPRNMDARLRTLWNERRVKIINFKSALIYARLLRARDSFYVRKQWRAI